MIEKGKHPKKRIESYFFSLDSGANSFFFQTNKTNRKTKKDSNLRILSCRLWIRLDTCDSNVKNSSKIHLNF